MSYTYAVRQVAAPISMLSATVPPRMENLLKIKYASDFSTIKLPTTSREGMMHSFVLLDDHEIMQAELVKTLESLISVSSCVIVYIQSRVWCEMLLETFEDKQPQVISTMYHGMSTYEQKITNKKAFVQETKEKKKQSSTMAVCQTQRESFFLAILLNRPDSYRIR